MLLLQVCQPTQKSSLEIEIFIFYFLLTTDMVFDIYDKNTDESDGYYLFQWIKNEDAWKLINYMIVITDADAFLQNTFSA